LTPRLYINSTTTTSLEDINFLVSGKSIFYGPAAVREDDEPANIIHYKNAPAMMVENGF